MTSPRLLIPELTQNQANKYLTHNEAVRVIDGLLMPIVQAYTTTPPVTPVEGQVWLIDTTATGDWAGHDEEVAQYYNATWYFYMPEEGWWFRNIDTASFYAFNGTSWGVAVIESGIKVSANDTVSGYLNGKLVAGIGVALTETNDGADETLSVSSGTYISANDTTKGDLETKLLAGNGISMSTQNDGAAETRTISAKSQSFVIALSDETTPITAGTDKLTFRMPYAFTLSELPRLSLTTAQTSGNIVTVDINEAGVSILSTKLTIDNTEDTSTTATTAAVLSDSQLADDAKITFDIDQIGDGTAVGLKVTLIGYPS